MKLKYFCWHLEDEKSRIRICKSVVQIHGSGSYKHVTDSELMVASKSLIVFSVASQAARIQTGEIGGRHSSNVQHGNGTCLRGKTAA